MLSLMVTAIPSLTAPDCAAGFVEAQLNLRQFELYPTWFDDNTSLTLAQTGVYEGVDDIEEYIRYMFPGSPYFSVHGILRSEKTFLSFDEEKRSCMFLRMNHNRYQMSEMANNELWEAPALVKFEWHFDTQRVGRMDVYLGDRSYFERIDFVLNTPAINSFVCETLHDSCADVWAANNLTSLGECKAKLAALPVDEGEILYRDGNTQGCRWLHAVFASTNANHCAHLSFKPMADPRGRVKCQVSEQLQVSDRFSDDELSKYATFVAESGFEPDQHWRLSPCKTQADCPAAGDVEEHPTRATGNSYKSNATCVFGAPTKRRLLFGPTPQAGVCVPA